MEELFRRRADKKLCKAVVEFRRQHPPGFLNGEPRAFLARPLFSADLEFERFVELSRRISLLPLCLELTKDRFFHFNAEKYRRANLTFRWSNRSRALRVIDIQQDHEKPFTEINTWGEMRLVDFHHHLLNTFHPKAHTWLFDHSDWMFAANRHPPHYLQPLALAITDGVLFENYFLNDASERRFFTERVAPSIAHLIAVFGVKPLIVRLFTSEEENTPICWQYPGELYPFARDLLHGTAKQNLYREGEAPSEP